MASLRLLLVALVLGGAGCTETGAHLTFTTPGGPMPAAGGYRIVLATPDPATPVAGQRVRPRDMETETVEYLRQRTIAGSESDPIASVDGFTIRIAPDGTNAETQFVPFVIFYNERGEISGIGTYHATPDAPPSPIFVLSDEIDKYTLTVEKVIEVDADDAPIEPGQARTVRCLLPDGSNSFTSGIAWRPLGGASEVRLVMPEDGGTDASNRPLDLDCDGHEVSMAANSHFDCDDTRNTFHRDAPDVCDGMDTNCDGAQTIATACPLQGTTCTSPLQPGTNTGIKVCNDQTGATTTCQASASCGCTDGSCHKCEVPFDLAANATHPCQPAVGQLAFDQCTDGSPCDVEIVGIRGGWKVEVSVPGQNAFGLRAFDVKGPVDVRAKRPEGPSYTLIGTASMPVADVDMVLVTSTQTIYVPLVLTLAPDSVAACPSTAPAIMNCN